MEPGRRLAHDLRFGRVEPETGQQRDHVGLGFEQAGVLGGPRPMPAGTRECSSAGTHAGCGHELILGLVAAIGLADLEQRRRRRSRGCGCAARRQAGPAAGSAASTTSRWRWGWPVPGRPGRRRRPAAVPRVMNDQVMASTSPRPASTRRARRTRRCVSVSTGRATPLKRGMGADGTLSRPAMRTTSSTRSAAPWMSGRQLGAVTFAAVLVPSTAKPSASSVARICFSGSAMPASFSTRPNREGDDRLRLGRRAGNPCLRRLAAGHLQHHGRGEIEAGLDEGRIDAALEAIARVALHAGLAAGGRRAQRIEVGALDQDVLGLGRAAGVLAAEDAAEAQHGAVVGDHAHGARRHRSVLPSRPRNFSPFLPEPRADGALELVGVVDVQRAAAVEADVVGDVDQRIDRPQPDGFQPLLHPGGRGAVLDAADVAAGEARAGIARLGREIELDVDGAIVVALDAGDLLLRLQLAEAGGRQIAGDAAHAGAVGTVGGKLHLDHGLAEAQHVGVALAELAAERRVELDDALVIVGELQLALRHQHAVGDDAAHGLAPRA